MAEVGYSSGGTPAAPYLMSSNARGSIWTMPENGTVVSMAAYMDSGGAHQARCAVYDATTLAACVLLDQSSIRTDISGSPGWHTFTGFAGASLAAGTPLLLVGFGTAGAVELYRDASGSGYTCTVTAFPTPDDPEDFSAGGDLGHTYGVYLTYTPAGGGPSGSVVPTPTAQRNRRSSGRFL